MRPPLAIQARIPGSGCRRPIYRWDSLLDTRSADAHHRDALGPAEFDGKSARCLHVNVDGLTIDVPAGAHTNGRLADAQEMIRAHDVIERLHFEHDMLQPGRFARHAWRESHAVVTLVAAQEAQTNVVVDVDPITQAKAQHAGVKI